jgi:photosystem II stability/assembly factor-like uncharacterized protein
MRKYCFLLVLLFTAEFLNAQIPQQFFDKMRYRCIGPFRGGRSLACAGIPGNRLVYYFGATGGGIWKTTDAGETWLPASDTSFMASSIGALAIAPDDPALIYAGTGEADIRGNISFGDGMYKSTDAGRTWQRAGLAQSYAIAKINIHPRNSQELLAACMGSTFGTGGERGIYKSTDGGKNWKRVLSRSGMQADSTGAIDIQRDPHNPRILYAALWQAGRNAWSMYSGGPGSGLFRSTDAGETWTDISKSPGLPMGILGKMRIAFSPARQGRIWVMVENENGGLFRSDDAGQTWSRISEERQIRQRPWYFSHIIADPQNAELLYALNVGIHKSTDGGRTWQGMGTMHGDHHDMWIDPQDPQRFILADDGGATVTNTGGATYTELDIPTAQFYHVTYDMNVPYRIYGCQQDNSSVGIYARTRGWDIGKQDWFVAAGGESGYIAIDPRDNDIIYGGNYGGFLSRLNRKNGQDRDVSVYPENVVGSGAENHVYRFQWTYPIVFSRHDQGVLYTCGNHVFRSSTAGESWEQISPDLTTNNKKWQKPSGGMITKDNTGVETYCTIFSFAESPLNKQILWAGTDDGRVHITKDGGKNWKDVTPPDLPGQDKPALISIIEAGHFNEGTAYMAATRYKSANDQEPYLYKTTDYGTTWKLITKGIQAPSYTRVIREDMKQPGLLFAGTETGIFVSFDDGNRWQPLQLNLPRTPIHDLMIHEREGDLIVATHGRSFWIMDDITPLRSLAKDYQNLKNQNIVLFPPRPSWRMDGGYYFNPAMQTGENAPNGVIINYFLKNKISSPLQIEFRDNKDSLIVAFASDKDRKGEPVKPQTLFYTEPARAAQAGAVSIDTGMNRFVWNMHYPDAVESPVVMWGASTKGPKAVPGMYSVLLKLADSIVARSYFTIIPSVPDSGNALREQFELHSAILKKVSETHEAVNRLRELRQQIQGINGRISKEIKDSARTAPIIKLGKSIVDTLNAAEEELVQTKAKAGQDLLNFPMKLNNKLAALAQTVSSSDDRPTKQTYAAVDRIKNLIDVQLQKMQSIEKEDLKKYNELVSALALPAIPPKNSGK